MRTDNKTLAESVRIIADEMGQMQGIAQEAALMEAAARIEEYNEWSTHMETVSSKELQDIKIKMRIMAHELKSIKDQFRKYRDTILNGKC